MYKNAVGTKSATFSAEFRKKKRHSTDSVKDTILWLTGQKLIETNMAKCRRNKLERGGYLSKSHLFPVK